MAVERLLGTTALLAVASSAAIAPDNRMLGYNWKTDQPNKRIVAIYVKMPPAATQFAAGTRAQIWKRATPISTSALVQNIDIGGGIVTGLAGSEQPVPGVANTLLVQNDFYFVTIFQPFDHGGNYWFLSGGGNPVSGSLSGNCIFKNISAATPNPQLIPPDDETFTNGRFAVDVAIDDVTTDVDATLSISLPPISVDLEVDTSLSVSLAINLPVTVVTLETESIPVTGGVEDLYQFGPCESWDAIWQGGECSVLLDPSAPLVTGDAVRAASEILYQLTAQRFGLCTVTLRPCRQSCGGFPSSTWWEYGTYPQPYWWAGTWYNLACGSCPGDTCSCVGLDETILPGPVASILSVKLDGVTLTQNVDYRVDDYRKLVRLPGGTLWPFCQDMNLPDTEVGTWSVTAQYGEPVPTLGKLAVGELAAEIVKYLLCMDCALPQGVVDISRQGVSMTIASIADLFKTGFIQLRMCDLFIKTANPNHMQSRSGVYDIDGPNYRATGTTP